MTYPVDICLRNTLCVSYKKVRLIPSKSAMREMIKFGFTLTDCKELLERGYPAPRKRSTDTQERWVEKGTKIYNIVIVRTFNYFYSEEVYLITHIGKFTRR